MRLLSILVASVALVGCTDPLSNATDQGPGVLAPPPLGEGLQFKMVSDLDSGIETERCQMFKVGDAGIAFDKTDIGFTEGSHHVLLFETPYTEIPTVDDDDVPVDAAAIHECPDGAGARWDLTRIIAGSQNPNGDNFTDAMPDGVAMRIEPGTIVLMNTHYINTTSTTLTTDARINVYTVPPEEVEIEAGVLFYYNGFIHVGAQSTGRARMRCPIHQDIEIANVQSHMHKLGVDFHANLLDTDGAMVEEMYASKYWENVPIGRFDPVMKVNAGQSIDYWCDYDNYQANDVIQGFKTTDEMCVLAGLYWPRNDNLEICEDAEGDFAATLIGNGTASCGDSYGCLIEAINGSEDEDDLAAKAFKCVSESCGGAANELSGVVQCFLNDGDDQCEACDDGNGGQSCSSCLIEACAPQIEQCGAATCEVSQ